MRFIWIAIVLAILAVIVPYWPLALAAILLAALTGAWPLAIALGMFFDVMYGRPPGGILHTLAFPMTALAVAAAVLHRFVRRYLRRDNQEYL